MNLKLKHISIENFKGIKQLMVDFQNRTTISGQNATGKTSIIDSFMWLLFGKDSQGRADFSIRPNDSAGKVIDNVVIKVTATLDADGKEIVLTKTQEQNWVKKRGSEVSQLQGNVNRYEINEIPKAEKDYKVYISELMGEDLFKLLTSPQAFVSKKWKDQRDILLKLVSEVTNQDVINTDGKFADLADMLADASVDDLTAKTKKVLKELNRRQAELPARIDEASKGLVEADFTAYEIRKANLEKQIQELEAQENDAAQVGESMAKLQDEITGKQSEIGVLKQSANAELISQRQGIQKRIDEAERAFTETFRKQADTERELKHKEELLTNYRILRETLLKNHRETTAMILRAEDCTCPMCGQALPEQQRETKVAEFEEAKQKTLEEIISTGKQTTADIATLEQEIEALNELLKTCKAEKVEHNRAKTTAMKELEELPAEVDLLKNAQYLVLWEEIEQLRTRARSMENGTDYLKQLRRQKAELSAELDQVKTTLYGKDSNQKIQERIVELQQEQREVAQKIANQEKGWFLLEEFTKVKMDMLSSRINAKFKLVSFRLFEDQINGGYKETCECMINGVPFSSLNDGHRVVAGLDIISALQEIYDVTAPIFIDNAESVNDFNLPDMSGQMILLKVSNDKELRVED